MRLISWPISIVWHSALSAEANCDEAAVPSRTYQFDRGCLVWELVPSAFANLPPATRGPIEFATMFYFSLAALTTTGYGDIVPPNPFARSLASLESVIGPFYLAITVARLVTMELEDRHRGAAGRVGIPRALADKKSLPSP